MIKHIVSQRNAENGTVSEEVFFAEICRKLERRKKSPSGNHPGASHRKTERFRLLDWDGISPLEERLLYDRISGRRGYGRQSRVVPRIECSPLQSLHRTAEVFLYRQRAGIRDSGEGLQSRKVPSGTSGERFRKSCTPAENS